MANLISGTISSEDSEQIGASGTYTWRGLASGQSFVVTSDTNGNITGTNARGATVTLPVIAGNVTRGQFVTVDVTTTRANGSAALATAILAAFPI